MVRDTSGNSYRAYWDRWAQNWEFQALLKARPCAGGMEVGARFLGYALRLNLKASARPGFVDDVRSMRAQVENSNCRKGTWQRAEAGCGRTA